MVHGLRTGYSAPLHDGYTMSTAQRRTRKYSGRRCRRLEKDLPGESETRPRPDPAPISNSPSSARGRASQDSAIRSAHTAPEGWRDGTALRPACAVRAAGSGQREFGHGGGIEHHPRIHSSPHLPISLHVAVTVHLPVNRLPMQIGGKAPPPSPPSPPTRWATSPQNRCTPHLSGCASADLNPAVLLNRDWHWTLPNFFDSFAP